VGQFEKLLNFVNFLTDTLHMRTEGSLWLRRAAASMVDLTMELTGGLLGSYFGAMVAALVTAIRATAPEQMEQSVRSGFGLGFAFWALSISIVNRVLIQGLSRASVGKKLFKLELISSTAPLTWSGMFTRWVVSVGSLAAGGAGYVYAFFNEEGKTLHDLIAGTDVVPMFESATVEVRVSEEARSFEEIRELLEPEVHTEPVAELAPTGTEAPPSSTLADVIQIRPKAEDEDQKKAA
jgi:hypothetical protein